jgi:hypothetical protein
MLDPTFKFSQHSVSDFAECPRRFYLRYVAKQAWPLVESGPLGLSPLEYQAYLWKGTVLHRWIERYWLGVGSPAAVSSDDELGLWWARFSGTNFDELPAQRLPELALVAPIGEHLLYARFDLLAVEPSPQPHALRASGGGSRAVIVDWKTLRGERAPRQAFMAQRWQTRIYLYVLATAGAAYNGGEPFVPEQCSMRYWLANFPEQPWVDIPYTAAQYEQDGQQLLALLESAAHCDREEQFEKTGDERRCAYCTYRTLCDRKVVAPEPATVSDLLFDVDAVAELDY